MANLADWAGLERSGQFENFEIKKIIQAAGHFKDAPCIEYIFIIITSFQGQTAHSGNETLVAVAFPISHTKCQKRVFKVV
jgi:hypothetical protein